jgi:hypothetical protein
VIRVQRSKEPRSFARVRQRGASWLSRNPTGDLPSYWREALPDLQTAFSNRCGYAAMHDLNGTVDHFVSRSRDRSLAYEWSNLRYAAHWLNASKGDRDGIIDPFEVQDGWFEVILPSLQLVISDSAPANVRQLLETTLERLPIGHDERIIRQRRAWLKEYEEGNVTLEGLRRFAPLLAAAVERDEASKRSKPGKAAPANRPRRSRRR